MRAMQIIEWGKPLEARDYPDPEPQGEEVLLHVEAAAQSMLKDPRQLKIMQQAIPRVDIPAKVTGGEAYVQDLRPADMVHGRVVRPPSYGAKLLDVDSSSVETMPGVIKVVRDGSFIGVIASREFQAIEAMRALAAAARWQETATLPNGAALPDFLKAQPARDIAVLDARAACGRGEVAVGDLYAALYRAWLDRSLMRCRVVRRRCHDDLESHAGR